MTSTLTLLEVSVKPFRLGRPELADSYAALHEDIANLDIIAPGARDARIGTELRAVHGLRTPDALQIAVSIAYGAAVFVTNDRRLRRVREIEVVPLDDLA